MHQLLLVVVGGALVNHIGRGLQRFQGKNDRTQAFSAKRSMAPIHWGGGGRLSHRFSVQKGQGDTVVLVQKGQEA